MKAERWDELLVLFERAIALPPGQRSSFVSEACCEDDELHGELESLIKHDAEAPPDFMRPPKPPPGFDKILETLSRLADLSPGLSPIPSADSLRDSEGAPTIPDYEIIKLIGKGGFGKVWLGKQKLTGVLCAIKTITKDRIGRVEIEGIREYKQRAAMHANLVRLEHVGETSDCFYYIMELADDSRGPGLHDPEGYEPLTLAEHLHRRGTLPPAEAIEIVRQLLDGLQHLHEAGLLHRDIKPANIVLRNGRWKLADLGLASTHSGFRGCGGTPLYSPPEGVIDCSGDLYSIGRLLSQLVSGRPPSGVINMGETPVAADPRSLRRTTEVIARACSSDSSKRFQSSREMRHSLSPRVRTLRWIKRSAGGVALLSVLVVGYVWIDKYSLQSQRLQDFPMPKVGALQEADQADSDGDGANYSNHAWAADMTAKEVTTDDVLEALRTHGATLIDAREPHEFKEGHLRGAVNLPSSSVYANIQLVLNVFTDTNSRLIVYCDGTNNEASRLVAAALRNDFGYSNVSVYSGGWQEVMRTRDRFSELLVSESI